MSFRVFKHFNLTCLLFLYTIHITTPCLVTIVDCTHVGSATASFKDLVRFAQENSTNQADVLVEDQLQLPLDLVTVSMEREFHKPNSSPEESGPFVLLLIQHLRSLLDCIIDNHGCTRPRNRVSWMCIGTSGTVFLKRPIVCKLCEWKKREHDP